MNQATEFEKLRKAVKAANHLNIRRIRIFTPEVPEGQHEELAQKVIGWMSEQRKLAEDFGVTLIHENDAKFWGAYPANAKRLFESLANDNFKAAFDFANTVLLGYDPLNDWFPWLLPYLDTIHIKDAVKSEVKVVPAGEGDARIAETLKYLIDQNWSGPLTLEPHLQSAGALGGFSGVQLFEVATNALRKVLAEAGGQG
jgi:sugar phosphate isomerase/epimerase